MRNNKNIIYIYKGLFINISRSCYIKGHYILRSVLYASQQVTSIRCFGNKKECFGTGYRLLGFLWHLFLKLNLLSSAPR